MENACPFPHSLSVSIMPERTIDGNNVASPRFNHTVQAHRHIHLSRGISTMNSKALFDMSQVEIDKINPAELTEINAVCINHALPCEEKILSLIDNIGNPYCFKSGNISVRVRFAADGCPLSDSLIRYFSRLKQN